MKKSRKKKKAGVLNLIIILVALAVMIFALARLIMIYRDYHGSEKTYQTLENDFVDTGEDEDTGKSTGQWSDDVQISFEALRKENPDIIAWIRFDNQDDVHISYPVLYSGDNTTYLRSDIYGNYHIAGCIFLEGMNSPDLSDYHSIIYGHNMKNTTMFGDLKRYRNEDDFYDDNQYFSIYTEDTIYRYQIFSYHDVDDDSDVYTVGFGPDDEYQEFLDSLAADSYKDTGIHPQKDSRIVTLSTCTSAGEDKRFVVHAVCIEEKPYGNSIAASGDAAAVQ